MTSLKPEIKLIYFSKQDQGGYILLVDKCESDLLVSLFPAPQPRPVVIPKTQEVVVGNQAFDWVPDYINIDGFVLHPKSGPTEKVCVEERPCNYLHHHRQWGYKMGISHLHTDGDTVQLCASKWSQDRGAPHVGVPQGPRFEPGPFPAYLPLFL